MSAPTNCPTCGTPLTGGGQAATCPCCLLRLAMSWAGSAEDELDEPEPVASDPGQRREAPGTQVGRYQLLEEIGEGGFAIVYLAEQRAPVKRRVALKILKPGMDTREVVARFEVERQTLALMDHPNIAQVYDGGATDNGRPYFVMEWVQGVPLTRYCDHQRLSTRRRLVLFLDVISAVQHAHQKGIIHRDLKPSNILVSTCDDKPVAKVIDFGIAKALGGELSGRTIFTGFGRLIGTPEYMSPEQAELNALDIDTRSDVYSLGVVLYELLTGRTPLDSNHLRSVGHAEIQRLICEQAPPRPSARLFTLGEHLTEVATRRGTEPVKLGRQIRGDLDWIVMKALEKDRARRYSSASGLAADIQRFLCDEPVTARPPGVGYRFSKFARRNKTALAFITLVAAILVVATAFSAWEAVGAKRASGVALERLRQASFSEARALRMSGQTGRRFRALRSLQIASEIRPGPDLRDEAVPILGVADLQRAEAWASPATINDLAAIAPDFSCHAVSAANGTVTVRGIAPAAATLATLAGNGIPVNWLLRFSPDATLLAIGHAPAETDVVTLGIWDWRKGQPLATIPGVSCAAADFSPDGTLVAAGIGRDLAVFDPRTGERLRSWSCLPGLPYALRFRPDGRAVAVSSLAAATVTVVDITTGQVLAQESFTRPRGIDWHRDNRRLAVAGEGQITIWNTRQSAAKVRIEAAPKAIIDRVAWSHHTELLASAGTSQQPVTIHDGSLGQTLVYASADVKDLRFSPDDTRLGLTWDEGTLGLFEVADGALARHAPGGGEVIRSAAWDPSGGVLATLGEESLHFWNRELRDIGSEKIANGTFAVFTQDSLLVVADTVRRYACRSGGPPQVVQLGRPEILAPAQGWQAADITRDGRWLAVAGQSHATLFDLKNPTNQRRIGPHPRLDQAAISPQGEWLATASTQGAGVIVWSAASGLQVAGFPAYGRCRASFSHDGTWLAIATGSGYFIHRVGSWEVVHNIPCRLGADLGWLTWSPRETVLAIEPEDYTLAIHDAHGFELITSPQFEHQRPLNFSPDGSQLTTTDPQHRIHLWDLAVLRGHLLNLKTDVQVKALPVSTAPLIEAVTFDRP